MNRESSIILVFSIIFLFFFLSALIFFILYKFQQKQVYYYKELRDIKFNHDKEILKSQVEIQENTFHNISREIHDNISQKLTLAKLYLNTLDLSGTDALSAKVHDSATLITQAISNLSDISRSLNSDLIIDNGLMKVIEWEVEKLGKTGLYAIQYRIEGDEIFLNPQTELILFRIFQESINNIIKHSGASMIGIFLTYQKEYFIMEIKDDGKGFQIPGNKQGSGLKNMEQRTKLLKGHYQLESNKQGTSITIKIPIDANK
jgi:signal transduction histidine kinase